MKFKVFLVAIIVTGLYSCKKDAEDGRLICESDQVKITNRDGTTTYNYDQNGRLLTAKYADNSRFSNYTYRYENDKIITTSRIADLGFSTDSFYHQGSSVQIYHYNDISCFPCIYTMIIDTLTQHVLSLATVSDSSTYFYTANRLDSILNHQSNTKEVMSYNGNGQLIRVDRYDQFGIIVYENSYFYDTEGRWNMSSSGHPMNINTHDGYVYNVHGQIKSYLPYPETSSQSMDVRQSCVDDLNNMNPINFYRYEYLNLPRVFFYE